MPIGYLFAPWAARVGGSVVSVGAAVASGTEVAGAWAGIVAGITSLIGIVITVLAFNKRNRRDYDAEMQAAEDRGEKRAADQLKPLLTQAQRDAEFWRGAFVNRFGPSGPPPMTQPLDPPNTGGS